MIGQTLNNRYQITARLGKGAMGTVYHASDTTNKRDVALKIISSELAVDSAMLERFKREGESLSKLKHLNIVGFIDAFQDDERSIIVMEYVDGGSLLDLIKKGPLPLEHAVQIALDLCDALISSHRLKIIHRDIKPENILIDSDGTPKLADFGVARLSEGTRMTRSGMQVGTPYYMSPEAWEGKALDAQADIWSLGVVLFETVSGQVPFGGDTPMAVMTKITTTPPPDLRKLRAEVPFGLIRIISKMLTRDKRRRYQSMREVAVDLEREQQAMVPHAPRRGIDIYQQIASRILTLRKGSDTVLSNSRSVLSRFVLRSRDGVRKVRVKFVIATLLVSALVVVGIVFFPSLMSQLESLRSSQGIGSLLPATSPINGSVVFSASSAAGEINFYVYEVATTKFSITNPGSGKNWGPVLSQTGAIYYTSIVDGKAEIYRRLQDGSTKRLTSTPGKFQSWGPNLSALENLFFTSNRGDGKAEVYRLIDGKTEQVTDTPGDFQSWGPALSILGTVYFTSNRGDGKAEVYRVINSKTEQVTDTPGAFESWGPAVSALGTVYFTSNRGDGKAEVYRLIDGKTEQVTDTPGDYQSWAPIINGLNVYYTSNKTGVNAVYQLAPLSKNVLGIESWTSYNLDERFPVYPLP